MTLFDRLVAARKDDWESYVFHPFVEQMRLGTLPEAAFRHYLVQDYLFLIQFARAYALAVYKARSLDEMRSALRGLSAILDKEMDLHVDYCAGWGISRAEMEAAPEDMATTAYTRFVIDTGLRGDLLDMHVALAPCVIGYAVIADRIAAAANGEGNPYWLWIAEYSSEAYRRLASDAIDHLDRLAGEDLSDGRFERLAAVFGQASRLEAAFWQMGLDKAG
jgi:thiaminase/transcriptional activator TenA